MVNNNNSASYSPASDSDNHSSSCFSAASTAASPSSHVESFNSATSATTKQGAATFTLHNKSVFIEALVDSAAIIIDAIWPAEKDAAASTAAASTDASMPLKSFIQETLRRSRTSYSTLQLALYYLIKLQPYMRKMTIQHDSESANQPQKIACGRRGFLACLILASKYIQDRNFSLATWSRISGLPAVELAENELTLLQGLGWTAHIRPHIYERLAGLLFECACDSRPFALKQSVWGPKFATLDHYQAKPTEGWQVKMDALTHHHVHPAAPANLKRKTTDDNDDNDDNDNNKKQRHGSVMRISSILNHATVTPHQSCAVAATTTPSASAVNALFQRIQKWSQDVADQTSAITHMPLSVQH